MLRWAARREPAGQMTPDEFAQALVQANVIRGLNAEQRAQIAEELTDRAPKFPAPDVNRDFVNVTHLVHDILAATVGAGHLRMPNLTGAPSISVCCDFGGTFKGSKFTTHSFLCSAYAPKEFNGAMREIRERFRFAEPAREIAYKSLRGETARALPEYLAALDDLVPGLLLTLAIPREETRLLTADGMHDQEVRDALDGLGLSSLKPSIAFRALREAHIVAYLFAVLGRRGQRAMWMTDHDEIVPDKERGMALTEAVRALVYAYAPDGPDVRGWARPFADRTNMVFHDMLSATDLAAGAVAEWLARQERKPARPKPGMDLLTAWLDREGIALRKLTVVLQPGAKPDDIVAHAVRVST